MHVYHIKLIHVYLYTHIINRSDDSRNEKSGKAHQGRYYTSPTAHHHRLVNVNLVGLKYCTGRFKFINSILNDNAIC